MTKANIKPSKEVVVEFSPVSERYWNKGDKVLVRDGQIRLGGCWFTLDERTLITLPK